MYGRGRYEREREVKWSNTVFLFTSRKFHTTTEALVSLSDRIEFNRDMRCS